MNFNELLSRGELQEHRTNSVEIDHFWKAIRRDLNDADLEGLSLDRRFATLYNAALQLASILVLCSGYRVTAREGHHARTFELLVPILGPSAQDDAVYFHSCRSRRHRIDYGSSHVVSRAECDELLGEVQRLHQTVETWVREHHPQLTTPPASRGEDP